MSEQEYRDSSACCVLRGLYTSEEVYLNLHTLAGMKGSRSQEKSLPASASSLVLKRSVTIPLKFRLRISARGPILWLAKTGSNVCSAKTLEGWGSHISERNMTRGKKNNDIKKR